MLKTTSLVYSGEFNKELTACLQECFLDLNSGDPARLARWNADPFWEPGGDRPAPTMEDADRMIAALDAEYAVEIEKFPEFHVRRSGANATPDWFRLQPSQRLGLTQRLARIAEKYP